MKLAATVGILGVLLIVWGVLMGYYSPNSEEYKTATEQLIWGGGVFLGSGIIGIFIFRKPKEESKSDSQ